MTFPPVKDDSVKAWVLCALITAPGVLPGNTRAVEAADTGRHSSQHVDVSRYFPSDDAERLARKDIADRFAAIGREQGIYPDGGFKALEGLFARCLDHYAYQELLSSRDVGNRSAARQREAVLDLCGDIAAAAKAGLRDAPQDAAWAAPYRYLIARSARMAAHALPAAGRSLDAAADVAMEGFQKIHRLQMQASGFPELVVGDATLNVSDDFHTLMALPDEALRQKAWTLHRDALLQRKAVLAQALIGIAALSDGQAVARGYGSSMEQAYAGMGLTDKDVSSAVQAMQSHAPSYARYLTLLDGHGAASADSHARRPWNAEASSTGFAPPAMSMAEVQQMAVRAANSLGTEHARELGAVLDPDGGRMDFDMQLGSRKRDAFSITAPGSTSILFVGHRRADVESDVEVVHEAAHAVHGQLMNINGTSPLMRHGAPWLEESFAILDEFLYRDRLVREAATPEAQEYYLKGLLRDIALQLFVAAEETQLEAAIHRGVHEGSIRDAADLDAQVVNMQRLHEARVVEQPELDTTWESKRLLYQDPLYLTNYLFAGLVAVKLYAASATDPGFAGRYAQVQKEGFTAEPERLVERMLGHPVDWKRLVDDDVALFDTRVSRLQQLQEQLRAGSAVSHR